MPSRADDPSDVLSPEQRRRAVAELLAAGLLRQLRRAHGTRPAPPAEADIDAPAAVPNSTPGWT